MSNNLKKFHQIQQDQSDCGVACLSTIIHYFGRYYPIEELRHLSGTNKHGTTMLGFIHVSKKLGFEAEGYEADIENLKEHNGISVLHVNKDNILQHYIVCFGYNFKKSTYLLKHNN